MFWEERDADIALVLWNYFGAVEGKWGNYWSEVRPGFVLNRTTGFRALMDFLKPAYLHVSSPGDVPERARFDELFARVTLPGDRMTPEEYPPGTSGQAKLRRQLLEQTGIDLETA